VTNGPTDKSFPPDPTLRARILMVDDHPPNLIALEAILSPLEQDLIQATSGQEALRRLLDGDFAVILMDVQMPGIDGLEATRRIRALGGAAAETPVVALTANVLAHQRRAYLDAGMDGVVGKPISPGVLLREIARLSAPVAQAEETAAA
jgi:CheY-like chemotaxis protein